MVDVHHTLSTFLDQWGQSGLIDDSDVKAVDLVDLSDVIISSMDDQVISVLCEYLPTLEDIPMTKLTELTEALLKQKKIAQPTVTKGTKLLQAPVVIDTKLPANLTSQKKQEPTISTSAARKLKKQKKSTNSTSPTVGTEQKKTTNTEWATSDKIELKEALAVVYKARIGRQQRMAVSRHHRSGRNNELMKKHEKIADDMEDNDEEVVMTTPSRFKIHFKGESKHVLITDISLLFGEKELLQGATLKLNPGTRYGMIGPNGSGKSTLLHRIANGAVQNFPNYLKTMYVQQEIVGDDTPVVECVLRAHKQRQSLLDELEILVQMDDAVLDLTSTPSSEWKTAADRLIEVYEELDMIESDHAEARVREILADFNFTEEMMNGPSKLLSGGWRMRVALAQALFIEPDILLLDEPTNHLDLEGILWLQSHLTSGCYDDCSVVFISHDREFLDAVATEIINWAGTMLTYHPGNFSCFLKRTQELVDKQKHQYESQELKRQHMQQTIEKAKKKQRDSKLGDKGNLGGLISSRNKKLEKLGNEKQDNGKRWKYSLMGFRNVAEEVKAAKEFHFKFPEVDQLCADLPILQLNEVSFTYNEDKSREFMFQNLSLDVLQNSRLVLLGKNGSGKSTLMNVISGALKPTKGEVTRHHNLRIAHFTQHHIESLDLSETPIEHLQRKFRHEDYDILYIRQQLGKFGISGKLGKQKIATLSGGQKSRVVLASLTMQKPHILLLDEPTNHLDYTTIVALIEALQKFTGAIILSSHSQQLISSLNDTELWSVTPGNVEQLDCSFVEYRNNLARSVK